MTKQDITTQQQKFYDSIIIQSHGVVFYSDEHGYVAHNHVGPSYVSPPFDESARDILGMYHDEYMIMWTREDGALHKDNAPATVDYLGGEKFYIDGYEVNPAK